MGSSVPGRWKLPSITADDRCWAFWHEGGRSVSFLDDLGKVGEAVERATPIDILTGIEGAVTDAPSLVNDVAHGAFGKACVDGRKVRGDGRASPSTPDRARS